MLIRIFVTQVMTSLRRTQRIVAVWLDRSTLFKCAMPRVGPQPSLYFLAIKESPIGWVHSPTTPKLRYSRARVDFMRLTPCREFVLWPRRRRQTCDTHIQITRTGMIPLRDTFASSPTSAANGGVALPTTFAVGCRSPVGPAVLL